MHRLPMAALWLPAHRVDGSPNQSMRRDVFKAQVVARMYELAGQEPEALGPGSKEKRSALEALGRAVGLDLMRTPGKHECGRRIADRVDIAWDSACYSAGDTITLEGLRRLLAGVEASLGLVGTDDLESRTQTHAKERKDDSVQKQERAEIEDAIAENIATLTKPGEAPEGVILGMDEVQVENVSFDDGSWMTHLLSIQGWLRLSHDLADASADEMVTSLSEALSVDSTNLDAVLPRLSDRLEKAVALRDLFWERLDAAPEGDATISTATRQWVAEWDAVEEEAAAEWGGPIHAEADTWPITQFVQYASYEELELSPSYQRAEVWPNSDSQMLIESVLRGIPLPSVILLQRSEVGGTSYEVVDGKQRLTAILRFMGRHPRAVAEVRRRAVAWKAEPNDLIRLFQEDYPRSRRNGSSTSSRH